MSKEQQKNRERDDGVKQTPAVDVDAEHDPAVARQASNAGLHREAAEQGIASPTTQLPHMDRIQAAFGGHDLSGLKAHVGDKSAQAMGAHAYATGDHVVFGKDPDLHTAAHEVAHTIQQQQGVQLYGGRGQIGDTYEQQADAVADRVVAGQSAGDLLGPVGAKSAAPAGQAVQMKEQTEEEKKKGAHDKAEDHSYDALISSMNHTAATMRASATAIDNARKSDMEPSFGIFQSEFTSVQSAVAHITSLVKKLDPMIQDPTRVKYLSGEFHALWGAYRTFKDAIDAANNYAAGHGHTELKTNPEWIKQDLMSLNDRFGGQFKDSFAESNGPAGAAPSGDAGKLGVEALTNHLKAATQAAESIEAGNDTDIGRLRVHINEARAEVKLVERDPKALKGHTKELGELTKAFKTLEKDKPVFIHTWDELRPTLTELQKLLK